MNRYLNVSNDFSVSIEIIIRFSFFNPVIKDWIKSSLLGGGKQVDYEILSFLHTTGLGWLLFYLGFASVFMNHLGYNSPLFL